MNVVDSSGWLEYLANASNAKFFAPAIEKVDELVVPTISLSTLSGVKSSHFWPREV